jgi:hypothetical protein
MMCTKTIKICAVIIMNIISVYKIILSVDDLTVHQKLQLYLVTYINILRKVLFLSRGR